MSQHDTLTLAAKQVINHWQEFGPESGFDEIVYRLEKAVIASEPPEQFPPATPVSSDDLDAWVCSQCNGDGWHWTEQQVGERKTDTQEVRTHCDLCEGLGFLGPDAEKRRAALSATQPAQAAQGEPIMILGETLSQDQLDELWGRYPEVREYLKDKVAVKAQQAAQGEPTLRDYAADLVDAGHDFWKAC